MTEEHEATTTPDDAPPAPDAAAPSPEVTERAGLEAAPVPQSSPKPPLEASPPSEAYRPNYVFLGVVSVASLVLDLGTKAWAKSRLEDVKALAGGRIELVADHLFFSFAKNRGGAWGLFQDEPESVRRPLFLAISALAIGFIVSLYRKLTPRQWALKWGLPLVLGGALGNLVNRIQFNYVVDFIDYRAEYIRTINGWFSKYPSDHWPTFNVADIAIVAGVILMAIDMFTPVPKPGGVGSTGKPVDEPPAPPASPDHLGDGSGSDAAKREAPVGST